MRGVPLKAVQELLGHSTIQISPEVKRDAVLDSSGAPRKTRSVKA